MGLVPLADKSAWLVNRVLDHSAAKAAGIESGDVIVKMAVNGRNVELPDGFPLPDDPSIRLVSLRLRRMAEGRNTLLDVNLFVPSPLEQFLGRPLQKVNGSRN
jgi:C-terminal processing protease CtpA/Prc